MSLPHIFPSTMISKPMHLRPHHDLVHRRRWNLKDLRETLAEAKTGRHVFRQVAVLEVRHESATFLLARVRQANVGLARVHRELQSRRVLDLVRIARHVPIVDGRGIA